MRTRKYKTKGGLKWSTNFLDGSVGQMIEANFMNEVDLKRDIGFGRMIQMIQEAWDNYLNDKEKSK